MPNSFQLSCLHNNGTKPLQGSISKKLSLHCKAWSAVCEKLFGAEKLGVGVWHDYLKQLFDKCSISNIYVILLNKFCCKLHQNYTKLRQNYKLNFTMNYINFDVIHSKIFIRFTCEGPVKMIDVLAEVKSQGHIHVCLHFLSLIDLVTGSFLFFTHP